jgi:hypothetical protein
LKIWIADQEEQIVFGLGRYRILDIQRFHDISAETTPIIAS